MKKKWHYDAIDLQPIELYIEIGALIYFEIAWRKLKVLFDRADRRNIAGHCQRHGEVIAWPAE